MSNTPVAPSRREQLDITAILDATDELASVAILAASKGDTVVTLNTALAGKFKAGKQPGMSIIVEQPSEKPSEKYAQPILETRTHTITICEIVMQNRKQDGTGVTRAGMTRDEAKDYVKAALHGQFLGNAMLMWSGTQPFSDGDTGLGYQVAFEVQGDTPQRQRSADPRIAEQALAAAGTAGNPASLPLVFIPAGENGTVTITVNGTAMTFTFGENTVGDPLHLNTWDSETGAYDAEDVGVNFADIISDNYAGVLTYTSGIGTGTLNTVTTGTAASIAITFTGATPFLQRKIEMTGGGHSGEVIRYTTDGSTPVAGGTTVQTYSEPFIAPASGTLIRAAATATGRTLSGITEYTVT